MFKGIKSVDMFRQTKHVESIVLVLGRGKSKGIGMKNSDAFDLLDK